MSSKRSRIRDSTSSCFRTVSCKLFRAFSASSSSLIGVLDTAQETRCSKRSARLASSRELSLMSCNIRPAIDFSALDADGLAGTAVVFRAGLEAAAAVLEPP